MKTWILTAAALAAALTLAGCAEDRPASIVGADAPVPGDPAIYAPDGWPLQIDDPVSWQTLVELHERFQLPLRHSAEEHGRFHPWKLETTGMHLVEGRVYSPRYEDSDPTRIGNSTWVYRGHFPALFHEWLRNTESDLPPEFHGKVEYR